MDLLYTKLEALKFGACASCLIFPEDGAMKAV